MSEEVRIEVIRDSRRPEDAKEERDIDYNAEWGEAESIEKAMRLIISNSNMPDYHNFENLGNYDAKKLLYAIDFKVNGERVLDYGCGIGRVAKEISPFCKQIYGFDANNKMIEYSRTYLDDVQNIITEVSDRIDKYENKFTLIYSFLVFQHIPKVAVKDYLEQAYRALLDKGMIYIQFFDGVQRNGRGIFRMSSWEPDEIAVLVRDAGFVDIKMFRFPPFEQQFHLTGRKDEVAKFHLTGKKVEVSKLEKEDNVD